MGTVQELSSLERHLQEMFDKIDAQENKQNLFWLRIIFKNIKNPAIFIPISFKWKQEKIHSVLNQTTKSWLIFSILLPF